MSEGLLVNAVPCIWNGGSPSDYAIDILRNGGLASRHIPSGKQVPHALVTLAETAAPAVTKTESFVTRAALPLQAVNAVTGVLNLGVGVYNAYQIGQVRKDIPALQAALDAATEARRSLHAESMHWLGGIYAQGAGLFEMQERGFAHIDELFALASADRVAERMYALELARRDLALAADPHHARALADKANEAIAKILRNLEHTGEPLARLPLVALAVQAYTAKADAYLALDALGVGGGASLNVADDARQRALQLIRDEQALALQAKFADNLQRETGLWLPDGYFTMYHATAGTSWLGTEFLERQVLIAPTRRISPHLLELPGSGSPGAPPPQRRLWEPADGLEMLWALRPGLASSAQAAGAGWVEAIPTVSEAEDQLGLPQCADPLMATVDAVDVRQSTADVLIGHGDGDHLGAALAPLHARNPVLIDAESVLWAYVESLLQRGETIWPQEDPRRSGALGIFADTRIPDASLIPGMHRAVADATSYLEPRSETRNELELLALVNEALAGPSKRRKTLLQQAASRRERLLWSFVALELASLSDRRDRDDNAQALLEGLERVAADVSATLEALDQLLLPAEVKWPNDLVRSWFERRLALDAALLAQDKPLAKRAVRAVGRLSDPWDSVFQAAHKAILRPHDPRTYTRSKKALELIDGLDGLTSAERDLLRALVTGHAGPPHRH